MGMMACRCAGDFPVLKIKEFRALLNRFVRLYIIVYAEFASVIDVQFPGLLCYDVAVGVACHSRHPQFPGAFRLNEQIGIKEVEVRGEIRTCPS